MRRDIYTLRATGMTLADVGEWGRHVLLDGLMKEGRKLRRRRESQRIPDCRGR